MKNIELLDCFQPSQVMLERVNYFPRQLLTVEDMVTERDYFLQKQRRHNRFLHGWGVVCGLKVTAAPTDKALWQVKIGSGYALGPYGDEIYVADPVLLDLSKCGAGATTNPCEPDILSAPRASVGTEVFIAIKYAECFARAVRAMPAGCACEDEACEYSRIRDSFQIECLAELPPKPTPVPNLCDLIAHKQLTPCLPCPTTAWVVLAKAVLPVFRNVSIADGQIDNVTVRRQIYSTAILQEQLIDCCCKNRQPTPSDPPKVTSVNFVPGKTYIAGGGGGTSPPNFLTINFSKSLNPATVNPKTILLEVSASGTGSRGIPPVGGDPRYAEAPATAAFRPVEAFSNRPGGFPPGATTFDYKLTVRGTGTDKVSDTGGVALDGEDTGDPGSDYVRSFSIQFGDGHTA
jgi:hypothetical protein